jgi:hypothetical protein
MAREVTDREVADFGGMFRQSTPRL